MMKVYLANAFSLNMLPQEFEKLEKTYITVEKITVEDVKRYIVYKNFESAIGHESTAKLLSKILNTKIKPNRVAIKLNPFDILIVFQLRERFPEGKILNEREVEELFKEGKAVFYKVEVNLVCYDGV